jgi:hypothetical protein
MTRFLVGVLVGAIGAGVMAGLAQPTWLTATVGGVLALIVWAGQSLLEFVCDLVDDL